MLKLYMKGVEIGNGPHAGGNVVHPPPSACPAGVSRRRPGRALRCPAPSARSNGGSDYATLRQITPDNANNFFPFHETEKSPGCPGTSGNGSTGASSTAGPNQINELIFLVAAAPLGGCTAAPSGIPGPRMKCLQPHPPAGVNRTKFFLQAGLDRRPLYRNVHLEMKQQISRPGALGVAPP